MAPEISTRIGEVTASPIRGLAPLAEKASQRGINVIPLNIGAPDLKTPEEILTAGIQFFKETPAIKYGPTPGTPEVNTAITGFINEKLGIPGIKPEHIISTFGASEAIFLSILATTDPGDEILIPDPGYPNYSVYAHALGVKVNPIPTGLENGFHLIHQNETPDEAVKRISSLVTPKTKTLFTNTPNNPTGAVYSTKELEVASKVAQINNLWLIADEVYQTLVFQNAIMTGQLERSPSIFDVKSSGDGHNIIVLGSASKITNFCGGRVGWMIVKNPQARQQIINLAAARGSGSTIGQAAFAEVNKVPVGTFQNNQQEFEARRNLAHQTLQEMEGVTVSPEAPEGAFYIVADLGENIEALEFCEWLLKEYPEKSGTKETIFLTPMEMPDGSGFYIEKNKGRHQVRIAYVVEESQLKKGLEILKHALSIYSPS